MCTYDVEVEILKKNITPKIIKEILMILGVFFSNFSAMIIIIILEV